MKAIITTLSALLLTACASTNDVKVPQTVDIPTPVSCVTTAPTKPDLHYAPGSYTEVFSVVRDLKGDREVMLGYEGELEAVVEGCK